MRRLRRRWRSKGVSLIIFLLVLVVIANICLIMVSSNLVTKKASKYSSAKFEAQQKADAIANYAISQLVPNHTNDITLCAMAQDV